MPSRSLPGPAQLHKTLAMTIGSILKNTGPRLPSSGRFYPKRTERAFDIRGIHHLQGKSRIARQVAIVI